MSGGWYGVDLDGTLAEYHGWECDACIGRPIPKMVERVKRWLEKGRTVKIVTARMTHPNRHPDLQLYIQRWLVEEAGLPPLEVVATKDWKMLELWDDRAVRVKKNTGERIK